MEGLTFRISLLVAALSVLGVVVGVVVTGKDSSAADWLALLAVAALVVAWRHRPARRDSLAD